MSLVRSVFARLAVGFLIPVLAGCEKKPDSLVLFCAAGLKEPVEKIAEAFEAETGVPVEIQFGGSGTLLAKLGLGDGDLYLAADSTYTALAVEKGLARDPIPVVEMRAGFLVRAGNPKAVLSLSDLKNPGLKVGIGIPKAASIGRFTKEVFERERMWADFEPTVLFPTVTEIANAVKIGSVDVGIVWDGVAAQYPGLDFVSVPEFSATPEFPSLSVLVQSKKTELAEEFCRFLTDSETGDAVFKVAGYHPVN